MDNIIFEDPSRHIIHQKRVNSSSTLKKIQATSQHSTNNVRPVRIHRVIGWELVRDRTDSYSHGYGHSSSHEPQNREVDVGGPVSLLDLFTLDGGDDQHSTDDDNNEFADDIFSHPSENEPSSGSITSAGASPDNIDALVRDVTVPLEEQENVQSSPKPQVKSDKHRSKRSRLAPSKAPSVISDSDELRSDFEDSKSDAETDLDKASGDRWEYTRIVARRIDSSGRMMAKVRWKDTWEPESELNGLETALLLDAKRKQQDEQSSKEICLKCGARKRKNFA